MSVFNVIMRSFSPLVASYDTYESSDTPCF